MVDSGAGGGPRLREQDMAYTQHVNQMREGLAKWNQWRLATPGSKPDLSGMDLAGVDLRQIGRAHV